MPLLLAQTSSLEDALAPENLFKEIFVRDFAGLLGKLGAAILILVVGWIVAAIVKGLVHGLLSRTQIDNRLASWVSDSSSEDAPKVEDVVANSAFWIVIILTVIGVLQTLELEAVSGPLDSFLDEIIGFLPNIIGAGFLLAVAWAIATLARLIITRALTTFNVDSRLNEQFVDEDDDVETVGGEPEESFSLTGTISTVAYWLVFLFFLPSILGTLGLEGTLDPAQAVLNGILSILPNVLGAVIIAGAGWVAAQVVRRIVANLLRTVGTDEFGERFGLPVRPRKQSLSWVLGTVVFVFVLIPTSIAALNQLQIAAISEPAIAMLNQVLGILPNIAAAAAILIGAYVGGQLLGTFVSSILESVGFNRIFEWLGFSSPSATTEPATADEAPSLAEPEAMFSGKTPSEVAGLVITVGVILFAALAAVDILNIPALTEIVGGILIIAGRILAGLFVLAIGLFFANLAFKLIQSSGSRQSIILAQAARISIIFLVSAMALEQVGVASNIVNLAFGLLCGAVAVAIAIAFGMGGRDIASEQIRAWLDSFKQD
ncbi:MAG: mechanosensitive ion channel [Cyanobacteria bacterium P01_H01_bin.15]